MVRTRLLTVADDLSAIGGAEIAQLRVTEGWRRRDGTSSCCTSTGAICGPGGMRVPRSLGSFGRQDCSELRRSEAVSECWARSAAMARSHAQVIYLHNPGALPAAVVASRVKRVPGSSAPPPAPRHFVSQAGRTI